MFASFENADIVPVQAGNLRQFFLREFLFETKFAQALAKCEPWISFAHILRGQCARGRGLPIIV